MSVIKYLKKVLRDFTEDIKSDAATSAADHLFWVRDEKEAKFLPEKQAVVCHHTVLQLLFISSRARWDTQTAIAFLTM